MDEYKLNPTPLTRGTTSQIDLSMADVPFVRAGQTDYDTGTGFWLGVINSIAKLSIGNSSGNKVTWDGTTLTITGTLTATTGTIGGFTIGSDYVRDTANSMGLASTVTGGDDVRFWAGDTFANRATAPFRVTESGLVTASNITITGGSVAASTLSGLVPLANTNVAGQGWTQTSAFSVLDADTVQWGAGTFTTAAGTSYSIGAGNTGNMAARTYIYLDIAVSTTAYQTTTTAAIAVGAGKVLVATALQGTVEPTFEVFSGVGGANIDASSIVASSITANEIAANTITANKLNISQLSAITADMGALTAGTITLDTSGHIKAGQTAYDTGTGFFLGQSTGVKFSLGNSAGNKMTWDGSTLSITGSLTATTGSIGGFTIGATTLTASNFTLDSSGQRFTLGSGNDVVIADADDATYRLWVGHATASSAPFSVTKAGAVAASNITITGGSVATSTLSGLVALANTNVAGQGWTQTSVFAVTDADTVEWGSGTFTTAAGTSYSISAGNTGNMVARTYIYLDIAVSTTAYQTTTTAATAIGAGKVLIATALNGSVEPTFQVFNGNGGANINGGQIALASISGSEIASATVTGSNIAAATITASNISSGTITSNEIAANTITSANILANTITASDIAAGTITGNEIAANTITAGKLSVSQLSAIAADMGALTAGTITLDTTGHIKSGQTAYNTGTGFFLGKDGSTTKFSLGNPSGSFMTWDGTILTLSGAPLIREIIPSPLSITIPVNYQMVLAEVLEIESGAEVIIEGRLAIL